MDQGLYCADAIECNAVLAIDDPYYYLLRSAMHTLLLEYGKRQARIHFKGEEIASRQKQIDNKLSTRGILLRIITASGRIGIEPGESRNYKTSWLAGNKEGFFKKALGQRNAFVSN